MNLVRNYGLIGRTYPIFMRYQTQGYRPSQPSKYKQTNPVTRMFIVGRLFFSLVEKNKKTIDTNVIVKKYFALLIIK
jgi:hypothetical protein